MKFNKKNILGLLDETINFLEGEKDKFIDNGAVLDEIKCKQKIHQFVKLQEKIGEMKD